MKELLGVVRYSLFLFTRLVLKSVLLVVEINQEPNVNCDSPLGGLSFTCRQRSGNRLGGAYTPGSQLAIS